MQLRSEMLLNGVPSSALPSAFSLQSSGCPPAHFALAVIGVGNTLAGDDGAGVEAVRRLETRWGGEPDVLFHTIEGDHFEIADLLECADKFIFVDAMSGEQPGVVVRMGETRRAFAPSFHQTDIAAVMQTLEALGIVDPFPAWEVWGVTIIPPSELGEGLTPEVAEGVERLCRKLDELIRETIGNQVPLW